MKFIADDDKLTIKLQGWEIVLGLRRKIVLPRTAIGSLTWSPDFRYEGSLFRVVGTNFPTLLYAGHFRGNGQRYFLYMHSPRGMSWTVHGIITAPNVLDIQTVDFRIKRLLLTANPEVGQGLANWWLRSAHPTAPSGGAPE